MKIWIIVVVVLALVLGTVIMGCPVKNETDLRTGPNLVSEDEAGRIGRKETPLAEIVDSYLQTCGPIYRVLNGRTDGGREIFVWVSDQVVAYAYTDEGISADEAIRRTKVLFPRFRIDEIRLVYIPDSVKALSVEDIRSAPGNIVADHMQVRRLR